MAENTKNMQSQKQINLQSYKELKRSRLDNSVHYNIIKYTKKYMDDYYLDGIIGLIPVVGDFFTQFFSFSFLYVSIFKIRSYRLTVAILFNSLLDVLIGLIPYLGMVLDFVHRSHKENFDLIIGFVNDDKEIIKKVNRRALWTTIGVIVLIVLIIIMIGFVLSLVKDLFDRIFG